jgi:hypothetical protein
MTTPVVFKQSYMKKDEDLLRREHLINKVKDKLTMFELKSSFKGSKVVKPKP